MGSQSRIGPHLSIWELAPDVGAGYRIGADKPVRDVGQPDVVRPLFATHFN